MGRKTIRIPRLFTGDGVTKTAAMKEWIAGFMEKARKRQKLWRRNGVTEFLFISGKLRMIRKI